MFGIALIAVAAPSTLPARTKPDTAASPPILELIVPERTLTVLVPAPDPEAGRGNRVATGPPHRTLVRRFAEQHALAIDWVEVTRWQDLVPTLIAGAGDLIAADITVTEPRKDSLAFTVPVHRIRERLVVRRGDRITSAGDLAGREIMVRERSSFWYAVQRARRTNPAIEIRLVPENTPAEALLAGVAAGRLDMAAVDISDGEQFMANWPALRTVSQLFENDGNALAWAVNPRAPNLREALDRFLSHDRLARPERAERYGDLPVIERRGVLRIITRNTASTFFLRRGEQMGFEYELLREFAQRRGLHVEVVIAPHRQSLFTMLEQGVGDIAAALLPIDAIPPTPGIEITRPFKLHHADAYLVTRNRDAYIEEPRDLTGRTVTIRRSSTQWSRLERLRDAGFAFNLTAAPEGTETTALIAAVGEGRLDLTAATSYVLDLELDRRSDVRKAFILPESGRLGWAVRREDRQLQAALNVFLDREDRGHFFNVIRQKYFERTARLRRRADRDSREHPAGLSPYDAIIQREAAAHGFDWMLIVAQMYQESRFNPNAHSTAGAIGLMQLLPRTAAEFGAEDPKDPQQSIRAAVAYLAWLRAQFAPEFTVQDRMWFTLAAYNAGIGHIRDARRLAQELDFDSARWFDNVEETIQLLSDRAHYRKSTFGYVRGGETAQYVREIRERYRMYLQTRERSANLRSPANPPERISLRPSTPARKRDHPIEPRIVEAPAVSMTSPTRFRAY